MNYLIHICIMIAIYAGLSLSLNMILGYSGMLSLCHAAFYGLGAYINTLLVMELGWGFIPALLAAMIFNVLVSFFISAPSLKLKGDYFVLATLGFQIIVYTILYNWIDLTKGPYGIPGIPRPSIFGIGTKDIFLFFVFSAVLVSITIWLMSIILNSPFGRTLKAIREDELSAAALGKNISKYKMTIFAIAAMFAAVPGALFAAYMRYIDPTSFMLLESVFILSIIIIGGAGNFRGPLIGTVLLVFLPEILRFLQLPDAVAANMRQIIYGLLIVLIMRFRPSGISGEYEFK